MPEGKLEGKPVRVGTGAESPLDVDETSTGSVAREANGTNFTAPLIR